MVLLQAGSNVDSVQETAASNIHTTYVHMYKALQIDPLQIEKPVLREYKWYYILMQRLRNAIAPPARRFCELVLTGWLFLHMRSIFLYGFSLRVYLNIISVLMWRRVITRSLQTKLLRIRHFSKSHKSQINDASKQTHLQSIYIKANTDRACPNV